MKVVKVKPDILCIEYRQDKSDKDYGSCLWARFYFNLDDCELMITSDCGNYAYSYFCPAENESFLEFMTTCGKLYLLEKIYGTQNVFDYETTKDYTYDFYGADEDDGLETKKRLDDIFENIELDGTPTEASTFVKQFEYEDYDGYFFDVFELPIYEYPAQVLRIVQIFEDYIKPKIHEILAEN
nr:hypothetical protein [uncultured Lachnoclostridium sp.]